MDDLEQESINQGLLEFAVQESIQDDNKSNETSRFDPRISKSGIIFKEFKEISINSTCTIKNLRTVCSAALGRKHTVKPSPR